MDIKKASLVKSLKDLLTIPAWSVTTTCASKDFKIKMSTNLPYFKGTGKKLRCILRYHKLRSTFYTENNLHKKLCKPKNWVATEDNNNIVYKTDYNNCN